MAKSKHERELARKKKNKDSRRRVEQRRLGRARLEDFVVDLFLRDPETVSGAQAAKMVHLLDQQTGEIKASSSWLKAIDKVSPYSKKYIEALADAGAKVWSKAGRPGAPAVSLVILQNNETPESLGCEPAPIWIERCKGFRLELLTENLDFYPDVDLVIWVTGMLTLPQHIVIGKARDGSEFAAVVHAGQWHPISTIKAAKRFLATTCVKMGEVEDEPGVIPNFHSETMAKVMSLMGLSVQDIPSGDEEPSPEQDDNVEELILATEQILKSATLSATQDFTDLAIICHDERKRHSEEVAALRTKLEDLTAKKPQAPATTAKQSSVAVTPEVELNNAEDQTNVAKPTANVADVSVVVRPLSERLAAVLALA
ncbi:MAG: hypothetical protein V4448_16285 [Pseudomonadota bacterium]